jgi:hypothetical protein
MGRGEKERQKLGIRKKRLTFGGESADAVSEGT